MDNTKTPSKISITQRLRTDLGRSVGRVKINFKPKVLPKKKLFDEGDHVTNFGPALDPPLGVGVCPKKSALVRDHEYSIPTKFH